LKETNTTEVKEISDEEKLPTSFVLNQNYPNPFNALTTIEFSLPKDNLIKIGVYNVNGQLVKNLVDSWYSSGQYQVIWDGKSDSGVTVSSGFYVYVLESNKYKTSRRLVYLK
jgi:flagellar hook assembly protein FlgD